MTLGDLVDGLREVGAAEETVREAERAIRHGGDADTMRRKHEWLEIVQRELVNVRNKELK
jgi:hypothetical protein